MLPRLVQLCVLTLLCLAASGTAQAEPCRIESFKGASYIVCSVDPSKEYLRMYWRGDNDKPYRTFAALAADLEGKGKSLRFATSTRSRTAFSISATARRRFWKRDDFSPTSLKRILPPSPGRCSSSTALSTRPSS
jgi:hypothetical protein